jgi:hypothetical protein
MTYMEVSLLPNRTFREPGRYSALRGQFQKWEGPVEYWLVTTGPDADAPGSTAACRAGRGRQRRTGRQAGRQAGNANACARDPEGNIVGMMQIYPSAR